MAKVSLPLLAISAKGTIGKSITFGNWRGINYARERVIPANPKTTAQMAQRNLMAFVVSAWQRAPAAIQNAYIAAAKNSDMTGFNLFTKRNLVSLRNKSGLLDFVASPGISGATPLAGITATGGVGQVDVSVVLGDAIPGTTVNRVHFILIKDGAPSGALDRNFLSAFDETAPYSATFSGLEAGNYVVYAFTQCTEVKGKVVYSVSLSSSVTVT